MGASPRVVFIGDDFTGASDSLASYARGGWRSRLFLAAAQAAQAAGLDAVGIATDLRAKGAAEIAARAADLGGAAAALGPRVLHYKICSTFDSAPGVGSIGAAAQALEAAFRPRLTLVFGGQPSLGRYCAFSTLFARGPDGAAHRIDRHPVMARHPVTPMAEADLTRHLAAQDAFTTAPLHFPQIGTDPEALAARIEAMVAGGARRILADALDRSHVETLGRALALIGGPLLLVGASSVAEALTAAAPGEAQAAPFLAPPANDACLIAAGSRSSVTAGQVAAAAGFEKLPLPPAALADPAPVEAAAAKILRGGGRALLHLDPAADYPMAPGALAETFAGIVARIEAAAAPARVGVAGGDSSSAACAALGLEALEPLVALGPGVGSFLGLRPGRPALRLMLKGGQMGGPDLFERFATG